MVSEVAVEAGTVWESIDERLTRIEATLGLLARERTVKDFYSTEEVAEIVGRKPVIVRRWCQHGRLRAQKKECGRSVAKEWMISRDELERYQSHGLRRVEEPVG